MTDRTGLNREIATAADLARLNPARPDGGSTKVVRTATLSKYPTVAASVFAVQEVDIGGLESEGQAYTTGNVGSPFFASNVGTTIPPTGTILVADRLTGSGRWVFAYNEASS